MICEAKTDTATVPIDDTAEVPPERRSHVILDQAVNLWDNGQFVAAGLLCRPAIVWRLHAAVRSYTGNGRPPTKGTCGLSKYRTILQKTGQIGSQQAGVIKHVSHVGMYLFHAVPVETHVISGVMDATCEIVRTWAFVPGEHQTSVDARIERRAIRQLQKQERRRKHPAARCPNLLPRASRFEVKASGYRCTYCRCDLLENLDAFHGISIDHFVPKAIGGPDNMANRVACCHLCNMLKADTAVATIEEARELIERRRVVLELQRAVVRSRAGRLLLEGPERKAVA